jgi:HPr kinase/phosphorylase
VPSLFGVASIREEKKLDLVVALCEPDERQARSAPANNERETREILGVQIPCVVVPVAPGRDVSNIIEAAALDMKLRHLGHDAEKELDEKLVSLMTGGKAGSD